MWAQRTPCELVFLVLTSLQTVSISSPVFENDHIYAAVGDSVTFPCLMDSPKGTFITKKNGEWNWRRRPSDPAPSTIWRFISGTVATRGKLDLSGRSQVSSSQSSGNFALTVKNVQPGDAGEFECNFQFHSYNARSKKQLFVISVTSNSSRPSLEGDYVSLECHVSVGTVIWISPGNREQIPGNTVVLPAVGVRESGRWTCQVAFNAGNILASHTLDVIGFTSPVDQMIYLPLGFSALLPCSLNHFPDTRPVSGGWWKGERKVASMNVSTSGWMWPGTQLTPVTPVTPVQTPVTPRANNLSVTLQANTLSDGGDYSCQLSVQGKLISRRVRVSIIQVNSTPAGDVLVGSNVSLTCRLSHDIPHTKIEWRQSNRSGDPPSAQSQGGQSLTLKLTEVTKEEAGDWNCQISQAGVQQGEATMTLNIKEIPYNVFGMENLILMIATPASVILLILISTLTAVCLAKRARRRRRALRRLRHPLCREHSHQLSNQPLCQGNDYISTERPLPPLPRYCPHQPRKGRRSQGSANRQVPRAQYVA